MSVVYTLSDLRSGLALSPPARLAVIGDPIQHSKSPQMHNPALKSQGIDAQYIRVQVPVGSVAEAFATLRKAGFWGINITIPHKFEALDAVDEVDDLAKLLGAVNTVRILPDGRLQGYNTDGPGYLNSVAEAFQCEVKGLRVMVLGAGGGAGRAVAVQSALAGADQLFLVNRTQKKAELIDRELGGMGYPSSQPLDWTDAALREALAATDLVINATSLGMKDSDSDLLPADALTARHLVFDMVYLATGHTALGRAAQRAGAKYVDGRTLLLHQGALSYQHWFQRAAPLDVMRAGLAAALLS